MEALRIRIPQRHQTGLAKLLALDSDSLEELLTALDNMPSTFNIDRLKIQLSSFIETIPQDDLEDIIDTIVVLHFLRLDTELSLAEFSEQICRAMNASNNDKLKLRGPSYGNFKGTLIRLLSGKLLSISTKAKSIIFEHDHVFGRTRVITDIRSVFGDDIGSQPVASVIVHMLKIHYIQDQQHKDIFLALDTADIKVLINLLQQAQVKAESLKSVLISANIPYIDAD
jgi:hypothetical protein